MAGPSDGGDRVTEPYYQDDHCTIYHGDNREILPKLSDVGLVLTSPPYNLNGDGNQSAGTYFRNLADGYASHPDDMPHAEYVEWQQDLLTTLWATLTDDGAIYYNHKPRVGGERVRLPLELVPVDLPIRQVVIWDRGSGFYRQFTYYVPTHEWVLLIAKPAFRTNTRSVDDVWRIPFETGGEHPAPFPLSLAVRAIGTTDAGLVLDPFMGSGTTLRAAKDLGRKAIGIEIEERYCEIAAKRLGQEVLF
jgi:site-specific DNA-methyltransferase (adenine-specific)